MKRRGIAIWPALLLTGSLTMVPGCAGDEEDNAKTLNVYTSQGQVVMRYIDLVEGTGPEVKNQDAILVHYTGWQSGEKFDSSYDRKEAFKVVVGKGEVIKGWDAGLVGMKKGGKRKLFIPAALAYGPKGQGKIKPNAKLVFEIEVLEIK